MFTVATKRGVTRVFALKSLIRRSSNLPKVETTTTSKKSRFENDGMQSIILKSLMAGAGVLVSGTALLMYLREIREDMAIKSLFLKNIDGSADDVVVNSKLFNEEKDNKKDCPFRNNTGKNKNRRLFDRSKTMNNLKECLSEKMTNDSGIDYVLLYGEHGQGKTTITNQLATESGFKMIEIQSADSVEYTMQMAKEMGIGDRYDTSTLTGIWSMLKLLPVHKKPSPDDLLHACFSAIKQGAVEFREEKGFVPVLIVDGLDKLMKSPEGKEHLLHLQMKCKDWADDKIVKVVLVASDVDTAQLLCSQKSEASRMEYFRVGDLKDDEIVSFLKFSLPVELHSRLESDEVKAVIAEITGGRMYLLVKLARAIEMNRVSEFRAATISTASYQLHKCGFPGPNQRDIVKLGNSIIKHADAQGFTSRMATTVVPAELENKLLHSNVLTMRYDTRTIGLASAVVPTRLHLESL